nr:MAG TPA: hypothetical protein [Caudoviricetes sp.]
MKERAISRLWGYGRYKNADNWSGTAFEIGDYIINKITRPRNFFR